jgi:hypothetical protein
MTDVWESAWDRLSETFRRVASSLSSSCPGMTWSAVHSDNKAFPFRAYATFNRGWPGSVDMVASVDFHRQSDGELRFTADIGFDDGEVRLDGPSGSVDVVGGLVASRGEIDTAVMNIGNFIEQNKSTLHKAMEQRRR